MEYRNLFIREFVDFALGNKKRVEYVNRLTKKRPDLSKEEIDEIIGIIDDFNNQRKEMVAIHWICNGRLILPEDMGKLDDAVELMNRFNLDYSKFEGPVELINSIPREKRARVVSGGGDPNNYKELSIDYRVKTPVGELSVYYVQDDRDGQMAVREIMNSQMGRDWKGPWCLLYGDGQGGLNENAWEFWSEGYNTTDKRVAFLNGKIIAFCASDEYADEDDDYDDEDRETYVGGIIKWWDMNDESHDDIVLEKLVVNQGETLSKFGERIPNTFKDNELYKEMKDFVIYDDGVFNVVYDESSKRVDFARVELGYYEMFFKSRDGMNVARIFIGEKYAYVYSLMKNVTEKRGMWDLDPTWEKNKDSIVIIFDESGRINEMTSKDKTMRKCYNVSGRVSSEYECDRMHSIHKTYDNEGRLKTLETSENDGRFKFESFYPNGKLRLLKKNDERIGWYENGVVAFEAKAKSKQEIWLKLFDKNGNLIKKWEIHGMMYKVETYENGELLTSEEKPYKNKTYRCSFDDWYDECLSVL